jgi:hypothetical protein
MFELIADDERTERERFESFLLELDALLARPEQDEAAYQDLLERHPIVFRALGYQRAIPKPALVSADRSLEPDFLIQGVDETWEVFELKRPDTTVVKSKEPRQQFYAEFDSYVSQCTEYARYFLDSANRDRVRTRYGIDVQASVAWTLVAGRSATIDVRAAHELIHRRAGSIKFRTFDDLRLAVVNARDMAFGSRDGLSGLSMHMVIRLDEVTGAANDIVRLMDPASGQRVGVSIHSNRVLRLTLRDHDREECLAQSSFERLGFADARWVYLAFDVASIGDRTLASIELNGKWFCDRTLDRVAWELSETCVLEVGADLRFDGRCSFDFAELLIFKDTMGLDERLKLRRYYLNRVASVGDYLEFRGDASMSSDPECGGAGQPGCRDHSPRANPGSAHKPILRRPPKD